MWPRFLGGKIEAVYPTQYGVAYHSQNFSCCKKNCTSANKKMNPSVRVLYSCVFLSRCPSCLVPIPCCFHSALCLLSLQLSLSAIHPREFGKLRDPGLQKQRQRLSSAPEQHLQRPGDVQAQIPQYVPFCISAFLTKGVQSCPVSPGLSGSGTAFCFYWMGFLLGSQLAQTQAEVGGTTVE